MQEATLGTNRAVAVFDFDGFWGFNFEFNGATMAATMVFQALES